MCKRDDWNGSGCFKISVSRTIDLRLRTKAKVQASHVSKATGRHSPVPFPQVLKFSPGLLRRRRFITYVQNRVPGIALARVRPGLEAAGRLDDGGLDPRNPVDFPVVGPAPFARFAAYFMKI